MKYQKIVINAAYGGFGISTEALLILIKRKAKCIEKMKIDEYYGGSERYKKSKAPCYSPDWKEKFDNDFKENTISLGDGFYEYGNFCTTITDKELSMI